MKRAISLLVVAGTAATLVMPVATFAEGVDTSSTSPVASTDKCLANVANMEGKLAEERAEQDGRVADRQADWHKGYSERLAKADDRVAKIRENSDERRAEVRSKVGEHAPEALKPALDAYRAAMDAAITARQTAHDAAVVAFRAAVDAAHASRKAAVDAALAKRRAAIDAAVAALKASCGKTWAERSVARVAFRKAINAAQATFKSETSASVYVDTVLAAKKVRNEALAKARTDFNTAHAKALQVLKDAKAALVTTK